MFVGIENVSKETIENWYLLQKELQARYKAISALKRFLDVLPQRKDLNQNVDAREKMTSKDVNTLIDAAELVLEYEEALGNGAYEHMEDLERALLGEHANGYLGVKDKKVKTKKDYSSVTKDHVKTVQDKFGKELNEMLHNIYAVYRGVGGKDASKPTKGPEEALRAMYIAVRDAAGGEIRQQSVDILNNATELIQKGINREFISSIGKFLRALSDLSIELDPRIISAINVAIERLKGKASIKKINHASHEMWAAYDDLGGDEAVKSGSIVARASLDLGKIIDIISNEWREQRTTGYAIKRIENEIAELKRLVEAKNADAGAETEL